MAIAARNDNSLQQRVRGVEDRLALKEPVVAGKKDVKAQTQLFTANGSVETYRKDVLVAKLSGRKEMEEAFGAFMKNFKTVYHFNGQQAVTINGDRASGVSYCMVTLIGVEGDKRMKTTIGVYYPDEYAREDGRWLIAERRSVFDWEEKRELG